MTTTKDLAERLDRLEQQLAEPPTPTQQAATDGYGNPGTVVAGELIEAAWGNSVRDHVVRVFPDTTALNAWVAPNGALAEAPVGTFFVRNGSWIPLSTIGIVAYRELAANQGPFTGVSDIVGLSVTFTGIVGRLYRASLFIPDALQNTTGGQTQLLLTDGSNNILNRAMMSASPGSYYSLYTQALLTQTGSIVLKARMTTSAGNVTLTGSATEKMLLTVEDIGKP